MSAAPNITDLHNKVLPMIVPIIGRIESVEHYDGSVFHRVICPAQDEFSHPSTLRIKSARALGQVGSTINSRCRISGYSKPFTYTDQNTGIKRTGHNYSVNFETVE